MDPMFYRYIFFTKTFHSLQIWSVTDLLNHNWTFIVPLSNRYRTIVNYCK